MGSSHLSAVPTIHLRTGKSEHGPLKHSGREGEKDQGAPGWEPQALDSGHGEPVFTLRTPRSGSWTSSAEAQPQHTQGSGCPEVDSPLPTAHCPQPTAHGHVHHVGNDSGQGRTSECPGGAPVAFVSQHRSNTRKCKITLLENLSLCSLRFCKTCLK